MSSAAARLEFMSRVLRILAVLGLCFHPSSGQATSFLPQALPETVAQSPVIVRGVIGMSYSDYGSASGEERRLFTFYELVPSEVFKGALPKGGITIRQMGGSRDGVTVEIPGAARFSRGEEVVVMLGDENPDGSYDIRSLMMGKFTIETIDGKEYLSGPGALTPEEADSREVLHSEEAERQNRAPVFTLEHLRQMVRGEWKEDGLSPGPTHVPKAMPSAGSTPSAGARSSEASDGRSSSGNSPLQETRGSRPWWVGAALVALWLLVRTWRRSKRG